MKRKLCFLFVLPLLFTACENVLPMDFVEMDSEVQSQPQEEVYFKGMETRQCGICPMEIGR